MVKASEFVACDPLLAFVQDVGGNTASVSSVQDGTDAGTDLWKCDRRRPFFFPAELPLLKTMWP